MKVRTKGGDGIMEENFNISADKTRSPDAVSEKSGGMNHWENHFVEKREDRVVFFTDRLSHSRKLFIDMSRLRENEIQTVEGSTAEKGIPGVG